MPNNPKEVTDKNETWVDLACQLPRYDTYFSSDAISYRNNSTRKYVVEELAAKYDITQNISLTDEIYYDPSQPTSLRSIQAKIMETNKNYTPIYSFLLDKRHQKLFNENIPLDLSILEFINFGKNGYDIYDPEVYQAYDKLVQILVNEVGLDPNIIDKCGNNALVYSLDNDKLFEFFIDKGVDPYIISSNGNNLLHHALPSTKRYLDRRRGLPCINRIL